MTSENHGPGTPVHIQQNNQPAPVHQSHLPAPLAGQDGHDVRVRSTHRKQRRLALHAFVHETNMFIDMTSTRVELEHFQGYSVKSLIFKCMANSELGRLCSQPLATGSRNPDAEITRLVSYVETAEH